MDIVSVRAKIHYFLFLGIQIHFWNMSFFRLTILFGLSKLLKKQLGVCQRLKKCYQSNCHLTNFSVSDMKIKDTITKIMGNWPLLAFENILGLTKIGL